jgi:hypothetical protein
MYIKFSANKAMANLDTKYTMSMSRSNFRILLSRDKYSPSSLRLKIPSCARGLRSEQENEFV